MRFKKDSVMLEQIVISECVALMDPGTVTGICIIIAVVGVVFWLPIIELFPAD